VGETRIGGAEISDDLDDSRILSVMGSIERAIYVFEGYRLDASRRLLYRANGRDTVELTPKLFELLLFLVERRGELVDKRELLEAVWPNVVVEENNLAQAISTLRRTLGERPQQNRFIATVPRRGYRFVADVSVLAIADNETSIQVGPWGDSSGLEPDQPAVAARAERRPLRSLATAGLIVALVVSVAATLISRFFVGATAPQLVSQSIVTTTPGNHTQPTVSPDGSYVAFVRVDDSNRPQIWVQNMLTPGEPTQVTFDPSGVRHPSWSPRNDWIVFESGRGSIEVVGTLGTPAPTTLIEQGLSPSYSFDGQLIVYEWNGEIRIANADPRGPRRACPSRSRVRGWSPPAGRRRSDP
jgi:DNA-binding winged helix-turn-helix (wHTH) protein